MLKERVALQRAQQSAPRGTHTTWSPRCSHRWSLTPCCARAREESPPVCQRAAPATPNLSAARAQFARRRPITVYDAHEARKANVQSMVVTSDGWELYEDRPKPADHERTSRRKHQLQPDRRGAALVLLTTGHEAGRRNYSARVPRLVARIIFSCRDCARWRQGHSSELLTLEVGTTAKVVAITTPSNRFQQHLVSSSSCRRFGSSCCM